MRVFACVLVALCLAGCPTSVDEREVSGVHLMFDLALGDGFWSYPFPSDARRIAARLAGGSHPNLWGFPNPSDNDLLNQYIVFGSTKIDGFGLNSPTYFRFDGPVVLPEWDDRAVEESMRCLGPVRIVNVDRDSDAYGTCLPARVEVVVDPLGDPWLDSNMVMIGPLWGFPLAGGTTYAVYLEDITDPSGAFVRPSDDLYALLSGDSPDAEMQDIYAPLAEHLQETWLADGDNPGWWVAAATVFTTQDIHTEMRALADMVLTDPDLPAWNEEEGLVLLPDDHEHHQPQYDLYDGSYTAWNFQEGEIPYSSVGGGFVWDDDGRPIPQVAERIPFVVGTPLVSYEQPAAGWPVLVHAHGTGGDRFSHLDGGNLRPGLMGSARGFLSVSISQPFHGDRWPEGNAVAVSLYSFNYFNPESGVSTFRQGALDTVALVRFIRESMAEGGAIAEQHPDLRIDPDNIYFVGHSQGGLTGGLAIPYTEGVKGWVLSGAGAGLSMTMMQREDPFVIRDALLTGVGAPPSTVLFEMHPLVGLIQSMAERTDPLNYAPLWVAESAGEPVSVLLTEGIHDAQTPADTSEALATAGRLPIVDPFRERDVFGLELRGLEPLDKPYTGNFEHPSGVAVTTGVAQFDNDHYAIFQNGDASLTWSNFLYSMVRDGPPGEIGASFP